MILTWLPSEALVNRVTRAEATIMPGELCGALWLSEEPGRPRPLPLLDQKCLSTFAAFESSYITIWPGLKPTGIPKILIAV